MCGRYFCRTIHFKTCIEGRIGNRSSFSLRNSVQSYIELVKGRKFRTVDSNQKLLFVTVAVSTVFCGIVFCDSAVRSYFFHYDTNNITAVFDNIETKWQLIVFINRNLCCIRRNIGITIAKSDIFDIRTVLCTDRHINFRSIDEWTFCFYTLVDIFVCILIGNQFIKWICTQTTVLMFFLCFIDGFLQFDIFYLLYIVIVNNNRNNISVYGTDTFNRKFTFTVGSGTMAYGTVTKCCTVAAAFVQFTDRTACTYCTLHCRRTSDRFWTRTQTIRRVAGWTVNTEIFILWRVIFFCGYFDDITLIIIMSHNICDKTVYFLTCGS